MHFYCSKEPEKEVETVKAEDAAYEADVVIVGAGGAGMTAALTAAEAAAYVK